MPDNYEGISFDRRDKTLDKAGRKLIGAGHNAFEAALDEAVKRQASFAVLPSEIDGQNLAVFRVYERVSGNFPSRSVVIGVSGDEFKVLEDWQTLLQFNEWSGKRALRMSEVPTSEGLELDGWLLKAKQTAQLSLPTLELGLSKPFLELLIVLIAK